ncbi:Pro-Hyp dipeptidase. Metallo peptidase. MEROPS family M38 [Geodermatophilus telluris]|uniref:Pro-Hyp dipeptidase. Metallo peptidase. MEROPS family M38 n=1 Tax=Geodermatophilus telluris TaxID=1190417 RepID=A0A1G6HZ66_9ACTN|nr:amidohydrolase family protein [Geodermatophilus telluris]SDB98766.1 Pro-Hyp dipeptidase. Metallo peptidase. MEROPS family M38 [Geodermatophilus telluris]
MSAPALHLSGVVLPEGEHRDLWVRDGRFTAEPVPGAETVARGGWLLPGLVDAHCHVGIGPGGVPVEGLEALRDQALTERAAGVLALRDCGSPVDTRALDGEPDLPTIVRAGRHVARTRRYLPGLAVEVEPDGLVEAVRAQARRGDGWVKLVGDWIDRSVGDLAPEFPDDVLDAAIAAAHEEGARVTAHTFGTDALPGLVRAGIDCVEHGTGLTEELIGEMAARGTAVVPTLVNVENFPGFAASGEARFPNYASTMRRLYAQSGAVVRAAYEAGVPVFAGTDAGGGIAHGRIADEVRALCEAGLPAEAAVAAASWSARAWLGLPVIEEGAPADVVVYDADPRTDLDTLTRPVLTVLRGRVV